MIQRLRNEMFLNVCKLKVWSFLSVHLHRFLWIIDENLIQYYKPGIVFTRCKLRNAKLRTTTHFVQPELSDERFPAWRSQLYFRFRVFNKVKSRSAHMKSHRPIPLPDSTAQESKRPVIQQPLKVQQPQQSSTPQQQTQQQQKPDNPIPQVQDHQQQVTVNVSDNSTQNSAHVWHNQTRLRPP